MLRPVDLIRLSLEIENWVAANGDLIPLPGKGSTLLAVALHRDGCLIHFRYDIPAELRRQVVSLGPQALLAARSVLDGCSAGRAPAAACAPQLPTKNYQPADRLYFAGHHEGVLPSPDGR